MSMTHNVKLNAAEIAQLWTSYLSDSMSRCVLRFFLAKVEDPDIRPLLQYACDLADQHLHAIENIMNGDKFPVPVGFGDDDVDLRAPRLYSDPFHLMYLRNMAKAGLAFYALTLPVIARADVRQLFASCLTTSVELYNRVAEVSLAKGIFVRAPFIPQPETVEFVHKQSFLNGFFGDRRPLTTMEISHLHANMLTNMMGKSLITGFMQVARSESIRQYMLRGKEIAAKHLQLFSEQLVVDDVPAPTTWDAEVTDSTVPPFSDKLLLYHIVGLSATGLQNYGSAIAASPRSDLALTYTRLSTEIAAYVHDGTNILIDNEWLEKIPGAVDRKALANV